MPKEKGFIVIYRDIDDSEIARKPPHFRETWLWLLRNANHTDRSVNGRIIKRGQLFASTNRIIQALKWYVGDREESYKKHHIRKAMEYLRRVNMISTTTSKRGMLITITKYDIYQQKDTNQSHTQSHNERRTKGTPKSSLKQQLNNETKVCKENTHEISLKEIEKLFKKVATEQGLKIKKGAPRKFFDYYKSNGWQKSNGAKIEDTESAISVWLNGDSSKN